MDATINNKSYKRRVPILGKKQLEKDIEHITEQMYVRNKELADINKTLSLLSKIDSIALETNTDLNIVCTKITEAIKTETENDLVCLFCRSLDNKEILILRGNSGLNNYITNPITINSNNSFFKSSIDKSKALIISDIDNIKNKAISNIVKSSNSKSVSIHNLYTRDNLVGLLLIGYVNKLEHLNSSDEKLYERISESIGVALDNKLLFEENQMVLRKLRVSNAKLKELDETKDDFISMASHQLRTPLTSVKGYISMLLEGDAGKINQIQKDMLGQAFFSSQRMVYLIADMLNVSRLKTGKFALETKPVNLVDIVEQEIEQLKETAESHQVKLNFIKQNNFPVLILDETKIRQVIMNFLDNAIYYTPKDGEITAKLNETKDNIELRVIDNGIGVPAHERHHLFTKFYRAGNARKIRPDGTGLGLYMCKKVIVAHGGTLIFDSTEGKGSTFGFIFNKEKLAVKSPAKKPSNKVKKAEPVTV